jgi:glycosyltransferase involved in cell wall biosynthesis
MGFHDEDDRIASDKLPDVAGSGGSVCMNMSGGAADVSCAPVVAVIIPAYRVTRHVLGVISAIGPEVQRIFVVDDCCPEGSGQQVQEHCCDTRVRVLRHEVNQGVGGAVMTGYRAALEEGCDILVKVDGDGQMDPVLIPRFVAPLQSGLADYAKGNRFFDLEQIHQMPRMRLLGNAVLSFMAKFSTGYWDLFDPTNGYTALHRAAASRLNFDKVSRRYFFETDMLFRLNTLRAVVVDVPMDARYGDETSGLRIGRIVGEFAFKHARNFCKRLFYNYYLRDMSLASLQLPLGLLLMAFGAVFGGVQWAHSVTSGLPATAGTVMLAGLPLLVGLQLVLAFIGHDMSHVPRVPLQTFWRRQGP